MESFERWVRMLAWILRGGGEVLGFPTWVAEKAENRHKKTGAMAGFYLINFMIKKKLWRRARDSNPRKG